MLDGMIDSMYDVGKLQSCNFIEIVCIVVTSITIYIVILFELAQ